MRSLLIAARPLNEFMKSVHTPNEGAGLYLASWYVRVRCSQEGCVPEVRICKGAGYER